MKKELVDYVRNLTEEQRRKVLVKLFREREFEKGKQFTEAWQEVNNEKLVSVTKGLLEEVRFESEEEISEAVLTKQPKLL